MTVRLQALSRFKAIAFFAAMSFCGGIASFAQDSGVNLALHANSHANAAEIGLPVYPGATVYKDADNDSADLGLSFGDVHFSLIVASYTTSNSPAQVLAFYRKPLSRYGEVLECNHGKAVGGPAVVRGGLSCSTQHVGHLQVNGSADSTDHELRVGSPNKFRIVGIDESHSEATRFSLVYIELPKDDEQDGK
jgi:hypothetical protein